MSIEKQIEIINLLRDDAKKEFKIGKPYRNRLEKYCLVIGAVAFLVFTIVSFFGDRGTVAAFALFTFMLCAIVYEISIYIPMVHELANATASQLEVISDRLADSRELISTLAQYDKVSLNMAISALESEESRVDLMTGYFIGAFGKLGLVPAVLAMYTTYTQVLANALPYRLDVLLMAFIVGIYLASCSLNYVRIRMNGIRHKVDMALLLNARVDA